MDDYSLHKKYVIIANAHIHAVIRLRAKKAEAERKSALCQSIRSSVAPYTTTEKSGLNRS